jgi:hypothetical protein
MTTPPKTIWLLNRSNYVCGVHINRPDAMKHKKRLNKVAATYNKINTEGPYKYSITTPRKRKKRG